MKRFFIISLFILLISCQNKTSENVTSQEPETPEKASNTAINDRPLLALTANALQIADSNTGAIREIVFGMPLEQLAETLGTLFSTKAVHVKLQEQCSEGSLKTASWDNGLTTVFSENKDTGEWQFAGWYVIPAKDPSQNLTTMAGTGIGSTRSEMESVYSLKVIESPQGHEFSTSSGLHGLFDGASQEAQITQMWSGLRCD